MSTCSKEEMYQKWFSVWRDLRRMQNVVENVEEERETESSPPNCQGFEENAGWDGVFHFISVGQLNTISDVEQGHHSQAEVEGSGGWQGEDLLTWSEGWGRWCSSRPAWWTWSDGTVYSSLGPSCSAGQPGWGWGLKRLVNKSECINPDLSVLLKELMTTSEIK